MVPPWRCPPPNFQDLWIYCLTHGKQDLADVIRVKDLEMERLSWIIWMSQCNDTGFLRSWAFPRNCGQRNGSIRNTYKWRSKSIFKLTLIFLEKWEDITFLKQQEKDAIFLKSNRRIELLEMKYMIGKNFSKVVVKKCRKFPRKENKSDGKEKKNKSI